MQVRFILRRNPFYLSHTPLLRSSARLSRMSTSADAVSKPADTSTTSESSAGTPLALPEATHNPADQLDVNGNTVVKLDHLGPIVINVDGTMSRISNWDKMMDIEKKNTLRIISKRNQERLAVLRAKEDSDTTT